jgi:phosphatidylglycerol---prolipoprotein diacylglyceryl transferase
MISTFHSAASPFGLFMVLAFAAAYYTFRSEYKRKEAEGLIGPFMRRVRSLPPVLGLALGFVAGAKLVYWWTHRGIYIGTPLYIGTPQDVVFSWRGSWIGGIAGGLAGWWLTRRHWQPPQELLTHPYQLMDTLLLYCGLFGFAGAIGFAFFENPRHIGFNGLNYYGALIAGTLVYLYINRRYGIRPAIAADIGSPGMMLAYAVGRMGCQLAGDGDWGIVNERPRPAWLQWLPDWAWAWRYPHNSIHQGVYIPGCSGAYCTELPAPVYPTPLYESVICLLLFFFLWGLRRRISRPGHSGRLFAIFALLNGVERFLIELIRVTPRYTIGDWKLSQAQILALGWIGAGLLAALFSRRPSDIKN